MNPHESPSQCQPCPCGARNLDALDLLLEKYQNVPGSLILLLQETQDLFGFLPRTVIRRISRATGHTESKIYGVASFYAQFRLAPAGKHLILLCEGPACLAGGSGEIERALCGELGIGVMETTPDGLFSLHRTSCLGCCAIAPVMMVRTGDREEIFGNLTPDKAIELLGAFREASGHAGEIPA